MMRKFILPFLLFAIGVYLLLDAIAAKYLKLTDANWTVEKSVGYSLTKSLYPFFLVLAFFIIAASLFLFVRVYRNFKKEN